MPSPTYLMSCGDFPALPFNGWTYSSGSAVAGRTGNGLSINGGGAVLTKVFAAVSQVAVGAAINTTDWGNTTIMIRNGGTGNQNVGSRLLNVLPVGDGRYYFQLFDNAGAAVTSGPSRGTVIARNLYAYMELLFTFTGSGPYTRTANLIINGDIVLRYIDSVSVLPYGGLTDVGLQGPGGGNSMIVDDVYIDTTGRLWGDMSIANDDATMTRGNVCRITQLGLEVIRVPGGNNYVSSGNILINKGNHVS